MASIPRPRPASELRSGGKMFRARRTARTTTPYDRPELPTNSSPQNPNWLSRLIYSPTRMIASGAGKIISSVFVNESSSSSSSSLGSENEIDDENDNNDITSERTDTMEKNGTSETIQHIRSEPQPIAEKSQTKHLIEQLLMQVTFSREECDRLTTIIKSRVADGPFIGDTKDQRLTEQPNRTIGSDVDMPDLCSVAVMEAKKWLEEKKSGSSPKSELEHGPCTLNSAMLLHVTEGEAGSPVDMAKSYMRTRPPWASPSVTPTEYKSTSPTGIQLFKEETPYSTGYTSLTLSKMKRDSPASASWNILDEIRKVRSKATEEMLRTPPSSKIDWSSFALENNCVANSFVADEVQASMRNKVQSSSKPVDSSVTLATRVSTLYGFRVSQMTQDRLQNETVLPNPATFVSDQNQDLENIRTMEETTGSLSSGQRGKPLEDMKTVTQSDADAANIDGLKDTNGTSQPLNYLVGGTAQVPDSGNNQKCSTSKEMAGKGGSFVVNGFPSSGFSLSAGQDREGNSRRSDENQNPAVSGHDEVPPSVPTGEDCQLLSEASIDVPVTYENASFATGSQNSSSMQDEGLSYNLTTPNSRSLGKTSGTIEKQPEKKPSRFSRRVRGRAQQTWELENNILSMETPPTNSTTDTSSSDAIFFYDEAAQTKFQQEKPWANDPHYFKRVKISALALLKMVVHARSGGTIEVMGLMQGKTDGDAIIVMDAFALPVEGTETRVNAQADAYEYMVDYSQTNKRAGRLENVVGWYHSHPGYGCWLSGIDVSTQMLNQQFQEPFLAVVIDPTRTVSAGKVEIGAFRTYPEGYKPPDDPVSEYQTIPLNKIEDFGVHCKQYYALDITYFKSSLDCHLLDLLWNKYWVNTLSSSPLLGNGDYVAGQISDLAEKLEQAENQLSHSRYGPLIAPPQRRKEQEDSQLTKITRDSAKITVEQVHGLMSQVIKNILFNSVRQSRRSCTEPSGPDPVIES